MKTLQIVVAAAFLSGTSAPGATAAPITPYHLSSWALHVAGSTCSAQACLPSGVDASSFDFSTGLGVIAFVYAPGPGAYTVIAGFDHAIGGSPTDEYGSAYGRVPAARAWEIDTGPALLADVASGSLDSLILDGRGHGPDDIAVALGWHLTLAPDEKALFTIALTTEGLPVCGAPDTILPACAGLFALGQHDPTSDTHLYLTGRLRILRVAPEPVTLALLGLGFAACAWRLRRHWRTVASRTSGGLGP